jgi:hypothetical protein
VQVSEHTDGQKTYQLGGGVAFSMQRLDSALAVGHGDPLAIMEGTLVTFSKAMDEIAATRADLDLSPSGLDRRLVPHRTRAVIAVTAGWAGITEYDELLDKREAKMLAVPELTASASAQAVADSEMRTWYLKLDPSARAKLLRKMEQDDRLLPMQLALLRLPGPLLIADHELKQVKDLWDRQRRMNDAAEAVHIASGRVVVDWTQRAIAHVGGMAPAALQWSRQRCLRALIESGNPRARSGVAALGFDEVAALAMERQVEARQFAQVP